MLTKYIHSKEDSLLLLDIKEGSRQAFCLLYDRYWQMAYNESYKRLKDHERAEDLVQDIFIQLWIRRSELEIKNLPAYLFIAIRNRVFKLQQKESRYITIPEGLFEVENVNDRADMHLLYQELLNSYDNLIETLPTQQKTIFHLRYNEDLSTSEIASKLEISPKSVRNQLARAVTKFRASWLIKRIILFF